MTRLYVPEELREKVAAFLKTNDVTWELVEAEPCEVRVSVCDEGKRRESSLDSLETCGWIKCATAWAMAKKHGISVNKLGALLNELGIKVRQCCLGCFK